MCHITIPRKQSKIAWSHIKSTQDGAGMNEFYTTWGREPKKEYLQQSEKELVHS